MLMGFLGYWWALLGVDGFLRVLVGPFGVLMTPLRALLGCFEGGGALWKY